MEWHTDGSEKFIFDNESVCIVYHSGELTIIMYGRNAVSEGGTAGGGTLWYLHPLMAQMVLGTA